METDIKEGRSGSLVESEMKETQTNSSVDELAARVTTLENTVTNLKNTIGSLTNTVNNLLREVSS